MINTYRAVESSELSAAAAPGVRMVGIRLQGPGYGSFDGARVETPVDARASRAQDTEAEQRLADNMARLIRDGRVRYNPPDYPMQTGDYFDAHHRPFMGVTEWRDGKMYVVRPKLAT